MFHDWRRLANGIFAGIHTKSNSGHRVEDLPLGMAPNHFSSFYRTKVKKLRRALPLNDLIGIQSVYLSLHYRQPPKTAFDAYVLCIAGTGSERE